MVMQNDTCSAGSWAEAAAAHRSGRSRARVPEKGDRLMSAGPEGWGGGWEHVLSRRQGRAEAVAEGVWPL